MQSFLKFLVVGTIGFIVNTIGLVVGVRLGFKPSISGPAGAELAIISNFILNNFWTFSDKSVTSWEQGIPKFIQFNILSFGSVIIQFVFLRTGEKIFGLKRYKTPLVDTFSLFKFIAKTPLAGLARKFSLYFIFYVMGVGVGLIVNFIIYSTIIWR